MKYRRCWYLLIQKFSLSVTVLKFTEQLIILDGNGCKCMKGNCVKIFMSPFSSSGRNSFHFRSLVLYQCIQILASNSHEVNIHDIKLHLLYIHRCCFYGSLQLVLYSIGKKTKPCAFTVDPVSTKN